MEWKDLVASLSWLSVRISTAEFRTLLTLMGSEEQKLRFLRREFPQIERFEKRYFLNWQDWVKEQFDWCKEQHVKIVIFGEEDYPRSLLHLSNPPRILTYLGSPVWDKRKNLGVVGSRKPSSLSLKWMEENLPQFLHDVEVNVVSGGARGIDQRAHLISIRNQTPTVCWIPSGLKNIYPVNFDYWVGAILESGGVLVSSFAPFFKMQKSFFHIRNLWIAQMSQLVFVVEANRKSGSMLTAQKALEVGKSIVTLPSSPAENFSLGNLDLLFDGAGLVRGHEDLKFFFNSEPSSEVEY